MKKTIIVLLGAIAFGGIMALYIFNNHQEKSTNPETNIKLKAFQIGVYKSKANANKSAIKNNGIVILDKDIYRVYITLLKNEESIQKMEEYFKSIHLNYFIKDLYVSKEFYDEIIEDEYLIISSDVETYSTINKDIITKYEGVIWHI